MTCFTKLYYTLLLINLCKSQCMRQHGPGESDFLSMGECSDPGDHEIVFVPKISRDPRHCSVRKLCYSLSVSLQFDLNDDYETDAKYYCLDNVRMWKTIGPPTRRFKACSDRSNWMDIIQTQTNATQRCPLPKGNYSIECKENIRLDILQHFRTMTISDKFPIFYGQYKVVQNYYRDGRNVGCIFGVTEYKPVL